MTKFSRFDMRISDITELIRREADSIGSNRIDSIRADPEFCVLGIRIPAENALLDPGQIEKEYKGIYGKTYFNPAVHAHVKDTFTFLAITQTKGNQIAKYVKDGVKQAIRHELGCQHEQDVVVLLASKNRTKALEIMGKLRLHLADLIDLKSKVIKNNPIC